MKKKAIKLATSATIAATAFVAGAPAQKADAAVNVDQLVQDAQNAGTVLKWAISVEGTADYVTQPLAQYNAAKAAFAAAEKAIKGLSASEKIKNEAKLVDVQVQIKRAGAYIDAITSSDKIKGLTADLNAAVASKDIKNVTKAYHKATAEFRKQSALLDRVYGQTTRDGIRDAVKPALEKLIVDYKYDVTVDMALAKVAEATTAKDWTKANAYIAEADKYLPQVSSTFKAQLTKNKEDALNAVPLSLASVAIANDTTLVVTLNKEVAGVATSEFAVDNGLVVTSAVLGADKKTVTLTTTNQVADKTYTLSYRGTTASFKTAAAGAGNITVNTDDVHGEIGQNVAVSITVKEKATGLPARNQVVDVFLPEGTKLVSANGVAGASLPAVASGLVTGVAYNPSATINPTSTGKLTTDNNGQLVLVVTNFDNDVTDPAANGTSAVGGVIKVVKSNGEEQTTGEVNFYNPVHDLSLTNTTGVISYVGDDYVVVDTDKKVTFKKSGDVFQVLGVVSTLENFKSKLSVGDVLNGQYYKNTSSVINLAFDKAPTKAFTLKQKYVGTTTAYRSEGNTVLFSGTGETGKVVAIYAGDKAGGAIAGAPIGQTVVDANGNWEVTVGYDTTATAPIKYAAYQHVTNTSLPVYASVTGAKEIDVLSGKFAFSAGALNAPTKDDSLIGEVADFTVGVVGLTALTDNAVIAPKATITVKDFDGTTVKYVNGEHGTTFTFAAGKVTVSFGSYSQMLNAGAVNGLSGTLQVTDMTGVTNDYGLNVDINANGIKTLSGY